MSRWTDQAKAKRPKIGWRFGPIVSGLLPDFFETGFQANSFSNYPPASPGGINRDSIIADDTGPALTTGNVVAANTPTVASFGGTGAVFNGLRSICTWVKSAGSNPTGGVPISTFANQGGNSHLLVQLINGTIVAYYTTSTPAQIGITTTGTYNPGEVFLVGMAYDPSTGVLRVYKNRTVIGEAIVQPGLIAPGGVNGVGLAAPWSINDANFTVQDPLAFDYTLTTQDFADLYAAGTPQSMIRVRETPALIHNIDSADGTHLRAGPDEKSVLEKAKQFTFETEMDGGFGAGTLVLPRPDIWDPADGVLLAGLRTVDQEDRNVYEARVTGVPKTGVNEIEIQTEGWIKNTEDDIAAQTIFINRNWGDWRGYTSARRMNLTGNGTQVNDGQVTTDEMSGAIGPTMHAQTNPPFGAAGSRCGLQFDAGPSARISSIYVAWTPVLNFGSADTNWTAVLRLANTDITTGAGSDSGDVSPTGALSAAQLFASVPGGRRWAEVGFNYAIANSGTAQEGRMFFPNVIGVHGLPFRGVLNGVGGYFVSDMAPYVITSFCPLLNMKPDSVEPTSFIITHADFRDAEQTARGMLDKMKVFGGNAGYPLDYFVYDNREFQMKSPGTYGRQWRMRRDAGSDPKDQGPDAQDRWNQVVAVYNPGDGSSMTVGPVGSGCDFETDQLRITDPDHVWNRIGQPHGQRLDVGVMDRPGAILLAQLALAEKNRNQWRGSFDAAGTIIDAAGTPHPPYMVRAGDRGVVEDDMDVRERWIRHTKYDDKKRKTLVDVGATPDRFDTMMARAGVRTAGLITS